MHTEKRACDRVYWLTHQDNLVAQQLYNKVAKKTGFIQLRLAFEVQHHVVAIIPDSDF